MGTAYKIRCMDLIKEDLGEKLDMAVAVCRRLLKWAAWLPELESPGSPLALSLLLRCVARDSGLA